MEDVQPIPQPQKSGFQPIYFFIPILLMLTVGFGVILGSSSRADIMAHWAERRCDFDVLMASFMYKPPEDKGSAFEFASTNFKFCIGSKADNYLHTLFGTLFEALQKQMGAADIMTNVMKVMRIQLQHIYAPFSLMMAKFWNKFKQIGSLASRIFQHLFMAMKKAAATATASIFVALSLQTAVLNGIDLIINIIMIVLYIMIALAFIFFLPLLPVMLFVTMAVNGIEAGFPGRTGDMGKVFCFAPGTPVIMKNHTTQRIQDVSIGDVLMDGQQVEAVIQVPGSDILYTIQGIRVSGDHRIWSEELQWVLVKNHPDAKPSTGSPILWTLITSNRQIPVRGNSNTVLFSDWEELPDTEEAAKIWDTIVCDILGSPHVKTPSDAPCFDKTIHVRKYQSGLVPISSIQRGDWIMDDKRWTQVIGICSRKVNGGISLYGNRITDGVWIKTGSLWNHPKGQADSRSWKGTHLITDSGTFKITMHVSEYIVRDFTEVGWINLPATYNRVENAMAPYSKN